MRLKNIKKLKPWSLQNVLIEKYRLIPSEAEPLADFLSQMLKWKPKDRAKARDLLNHSWLRKNDEYNVWMTKTHLKEYKLVNIEKYPGYIEELK
jgi:serine/threonine protein kinase